MLDPFTRTCNLRYSTRGVRICSQCSLNGVYRCGGHRTRRYSEPPACWTVTCGKWGCSTSFWRDSLWMRREAPAGGASLSPMSISSVMVACFECREVTRLPRNNNNETRSVGWRSSRRSDHRQEWRGTAPSIERFWSRRKIPAIDHKSRQPNTRPR